MADPNEVAQLRTALVSGNTYTSLDVFGLNQPLGQNENIVIGYGTTQTQTVVAQSASQGSQVIPVTSFVANANYAAGQLVGVVVAVQTTALVPAAANVLNAFSSVTASVAQTTLITVPQGRTWIGTATISCAVTLAAAATTASVEALGVVATAGTGVVPTAGNVFAVSASAGANAATGSTGTQGHNTGSARLVVIAPAGNAVQIQYFTSQVGTYSRVSVSLIGELQ